MSRKKIVIVASLAFIIISILAGAAKSSKLNNETESKMIIAPSDINIENPNRNYVIVNDLNFTISNISIRNTNMENNNNVAWFSVYYNLENIGYEPKEPLGIGTFVLKDSIGRTFTPTSSPVYPVESISDAVANGVFIQPSLATSSHVTFTIAFDPDLEYTIFVKDKPINLGKARDIGLDYEYAVKLAIQNRDTAYCDIIHDMDKDTKSYCLDSYYKEFNQ